MQKKSNLYYKLIFVDPQHKIYTKLLKIMSGNTFKLKSYTSKVAKHFKSTFAKNILFISQKFSTKYEDKNRNYDFVKSFFYAK